MDKMARIRLLIFFFPIGAIMVLAGVSTKAIAFTYVGMTAGVLVVIVVAIVVRSDTSSTAGTVTTAQLGIL